MPTTLITGGAGFIGSRVASALAGAGRDVVVLDNLHPQVHGGRGVPAELDERVRFIPGDVSIDGTWATLLQMVRPDVIVHLAAETGTGQSLAEASRHGNVNVVGTTRMMDALMGADCIPTSIVLASSRAVYGEGAWLDEAGATFYPGPRRHDDLVAGRWDPSSPSGAPARPIASSSALTTPTPTNVYAATKLAQEHLLEAWCAATGTGLTTLRLQNVYGAGQSITNSYTGVLTFFGRTALQGATIDVFEDGEILRDFVHVDDVVRAIVSSVDADGAAVRRLDIGSGHSTTIAEVATLIASIAGSPTPVVSGRFRDGDVRASICDISEAERQIGYRPITSLADGISGMLQWMPTTGLV